MTISEKFEQQPWASKLARRKNNFKLMCEHVDLHYSSDYRPKVVETGTAWDKDNWDGQGQSTLVWNWLAHETGCEVISIDIRKEASDMASEFTDKVSYIIADSVKALNDLEDPEDITLLYLDSMDWSAEMNFDSAFHHIAELTTVYSKLSPGCMIVVDDRHGDGKGKHWMVEFFFKKLGIAPVFKNHQIGWVKP